MDMTSTQQLDYVRERIEDAFADYDDSDDDVATVVLSEPFTSPWTQAQEMVLTLKDEDDQSIGRVRVTISVA